MSRPSRFSWPLAPILAWGAIVATTVGLTSCASKELSRSKAQSLLNDHPEIAQVGETVRLLNNGREGVHLDLWDANRRVTSTGIFRQVDPTSTTARLTTALAVVVEVTGIVQGATDATVEFEWELQNTPLLLRAVSHTKGTGMAEAALYDDGWRVTAVEVRRDAKLSPADESEIAQIKDSIRTLRQQRIDAADQAFESCRQFPSVEPVMGVLYVLRAGGLSTSADKVFVSANGIRIGTSDFTFYDDPRLFNTSDVHVRIEPPQYRDFVIDRSSARAMVSVVPSNTSGTNKVYFASREAAQQFLAKADAARAAWETSCGSTVASWEELQGLRGSWGL